LRHRKLEYERGRREVQKEDVQGRRVLHLVSPGKGRGKSRETHLERRKCISEGSKRKSLREIPKNARSRSTTSDLNFASHTC